MAIPYYIEILAYVLDYFALYLILCFGINYIMHGRKNDSEIVRRYSFGLGMFFISIAISSALYMIDLTSRTFFGGRLFPAQAEYEEMGYYFASFHPQFYFIIILAFLLLSFSFLMNPIENYIINGTKKIIYKLCWIFSPVPFILRILELLTLPQEGSMLYWIYSVFYILCWFVIVICALTLLGLYIKMASSGTGEVRKRSMAIIGGILVWLVAIFMKPTFFKSLNDFLYFFWAIPVLEILMILLFTFGFGENIQSEQLDKTIYLYEHWLFKVLVAGVLGLVGIYFSILFWDADLTLVAYWSTTGSNELYATFMDQSMFEGDGFGGQDFFYIMIIPAVLIYFFSYIPKFEEKLLPIRKYCGFIIVVALAVTVGGSRVMKWVFARARPGDALNGEYEFSNLLTFGSYSLSKAFSRGSFPSGHTFTAMGLIALAFITIKTHKTWLISLAFTICIGYGVAMGVGRVMEGAHYPGDTLWAIIFSIILTIWIYFSIMKIPKQEAGELEFTKKFAELRIGINLVFFEFAIGLIVVGIRYSIIEFMWYWPLAILGGIGIALYFAWRVKVVRS